jgi:GT2 family glycosyltransferase
MRYSVRAGLFRNELCGQRGFRYTLYIGNPAAIDREKFLQLGGYDTLYLPGTFEDLDLCYRAWQRGWSCLYEDRAVAYHQEDASFGKVYGSRRRQIMSARNAYLFVWKNVRDARILLINIFLYPFMLVFNLMRMRSDLAHGSLQALKMLPAVMAKRKESKSFVARKDSEIRGILRQN